MLPVDIAPLEGSLPLLALPAAGLPAFLAARDGGGFLRASGFAARAGELRLIPGEGGGLAGAVLGLGSGGAETGLLPLACSPWSYGSLPLTLPEGSAWHLDGATPEQEAAAALGWSLGAYRFTRYRAAGRAPARLRLRAEPRRALAEAAAIWRARDLINTPAADLGPAELAEAVATLGRDHGAEVEILHGAALEEGFPAIAAVGQGSHRAPRVALLRWGRPEHPLLALCGKGVVFDTGGLDIKSAEGMRRMKKDMGGAAVLIGLAALVMTRALPVRLLLAVGCVENAISDRALRPSDIIRTRAGLRVEIGNTDAEGRLVLADLLAYAGALEPWLTLDCATLTGAARVALGPDLPALFASDRALAATLQAAGEAVQDPLWPLPLHSGYASWLDSPVADMNNVASRPMAGAIVAALFLRRFVPEHLRWAHLDLYAWNDSSRPGRPEGGEAQALRALHAGLEKLISGGDEDMVISKP
ncbi:leucyl aminopeptidase family protein [Roseomonas sp. GC11]|uniref:leucyl aminopeptidase family protein n=1 Tax=Roseomonas sp. GC11 TaxID=2950546 RepID=UPI00210BEADB|nr:leucyl aminopeptidase family protein [Roseomonas sp. GC11]MCQ4161895.1 leucyl aminopeptidase family protein [Roseomonas sp. GC11]